MPDLSNVSRKRVLLTGATGFIGCYLVRRLLTEGWDVHIICRSQSSLNSLMNVADKINVHRFDESKAGLSEICVGIKPAIVVHLASLFIAEHEPNDVRRLINSNVLFGAELLEGMVAAGCSNLVNIGTSWQHYEDRDYDPVALYAATKQAFEDIVKFYVSARGLHAITLKLFDTYGPGDQRKKLFTFLRDAARHHCPLAMSPGHQSLHLVYIDDVIDAIIRAIRLMLSGEIKNGTFAVDSQDAISLKEVVKIYSDLIALPIDVRWGERTYRKREVMRPWSKGKRLPGWAPAVGLKEGIARMEAADPLRSPS